MDVPIMWKVWFVDGKLGFFCSVFGEWDSYLVESWIMEDNGVMMVFKICRGMKFLSGWFVNV